MLRLDEDGDGWVSEQEVAKALKQMGLTQEQSATAFANAAQRNLTVAVKLAKRTTLKQDSANEALIQAGWPVPLKSRYVFSSQDGYPLGKVAVDVVAKRDDGKMERRSARMDRRGSPYYGWPDFVDDPTQHPKNVWHNRRFERTACELDLDRCFVGPFGEVLKNGKLEWEQVFKQFSYVDGACGDCLIHHLVASSGERGLDAFLPAADRISNGKGLRSTSNQVPHLPLTSVWNSSTPDINSAYEFEQPCFSVSCILSNSGYSSGSLRHFAVQLIQRYAYTIAESPIKFERLETLYNSESVWKGLDESLARSSALERLGVGEAGAWKESQRMVDVNRPGFVCINDDITNTWAQKVGTAFEAWLGRVWSDKVGWEL